MARKKKSICIFNLINTPLFFLCVWVKTEHKKRLKVLLYSALRMRSAITHPCGAAVKFLPLCSVSWINLISCCLLKRWTYARSAESRLKQHVCVCTIWRGWGWALGRCCEQSWAEYEGREDLLTAGARNTSPDLHLDAADRAGDLISTSHYSPCERLMRNPAQLGASQVLWVLPSGICGACSNFRCLYHIVKGTELLKKYLRVNLGKECVKGLTEVQADDIGWSSLSADAASPWTLCPILGPQYENDVKVFKYI